MHFSIKKAIATITCALALSTTSIPAYAEEYFNLPSPMADTSSGLYPTASEEKDFEYLKKPVISFTNEEYIMFEYILQQEIGGGSLRHKRIVAQIIVNRVKSSAFPNTITGVLTQKNQFSSLWNYYKKTNKPNATTKQAAYEVLYGLVPDESKGALYFYSGSYNSWFENSLTFLFAMEGHRFFK